MKWMDIISLCHSDKASRLSLPLSPVIEQDFMDHLLLGIVSISVYWPVWLLMV